MKQSEKINIRCATSGKKKYHKKQARHAQNMTAKMHNKKIGIYKCPDCRYYHLTSKEYQY